MAGKQNEYYKELEEKICLEYQAGVDSLRDIADRFNTNHKLVGRYLRKNNIEILKAPPKPMSDAHKRKIGEKSKGRVAWNKVIKMPKESVCKSMATHLRFDVDYKWLSKFEDMNKLKLLNKSLTKERDTPDISTEFYILFISKFYYNKQFNFIYEKYMQNGLQKLMRPSLDHIVPKSRGGSNELDNLQFLTWFENFSKRDMM